METRERESEIEVETDLPLTAEESACVIQPRAMTGFVVTPYVREVTERTLGYIRAGFPVHFRGAAGTGKTTLAMHVAHQLGRPVVLFHGDDQYETKDLVGGEHGYRYRFLRDNFISRVLKVEENMHKQWVDSRLTVACKHGLTLIYDEYTRSRPEANNVLLSILQEHVLDLPPAREGGEAYVRVHPRFTAIFTSNPEEYAGVHKSQDALRDRMVTIDISYPDAETEVAIVRAKALLSQQDAEVVVGLVRCVRERGTFDFAPTVRAAIMISRALQASRIPASAAEPRFRRICQDILASETSRSGSGERYASIRTLVDALLGDPTLARSYAQPVRAVATAVR